MRNATKFLFLMVDRCALLVLVNIKTNLKIGCAVYFALLLNIVQYMSFEYICKFILYYIYIQYIHFMPVTLLQNDQNGQHNQQSQMYVTFLFCRLHDFY